MRYWRARRPRTCIVQPQRACSPRLTRGWTKSIGACLNGKKRANWGAVHAATRSAPEQAGAAGVFTLAGNAAAVFGARLAARASAASIDPRALPHAAPIARLGW